MNCIFFDFLSCSCLTSIAETTSLYDQIRNPTCGSGAFVLWLYSSILGLGRLHDTFRFISVTSRRVGRTPLTGDQLVARPLLTAPGDCEDGEFGGMKCGWQGKPKYSEKTLSRRHFVHHKSHLPDPGRRGGKPATNRSNYGAACGSGVQTGLRKVLSSILDKVLRSLS
jgi:hypothetical protein